jgi:hypothetical protein
VPDIRFSSEKLRDMCAHRQNAERALGVERASVLRRRLDDLHAASTLDEFIALPHVRSLRTSTAINVFIDRELTMVIDASRSKASSSRGNDSSPVTITAIEDGNAASRNRSVLTR